MNEPSEVAQVQLVFNFLISDTDDQVRKVAVRVLDTAVLKEALSKALSEYSRLYKESTAKLKPSSLSVRLSKKNGKPKTDYPEVKKDTVVKKLGAQAFTIQMKTDLSRSESNSLSDIDKQIMDMGIENNGQLLEQKRETKCCKCTIF